MSIDNDSYAALMAELRQTFLDRIATDIPAFTAAWQQALSPSGRDGGLGALAHLSHRLAGLGQTFGFPDMTDQARLIEVAAERLLQNDAAISPDMHDLIRNFIHTMEHSLEQ